MKMRIFFGERPASKLDVVTVEEVGRDVGGLIGRARVLGIAGDVDASQGHLATVNIAELAILDEQPKPGHFLSSFLYRSQRLVIWVRKETGK
jgi:hypothetical protein